MDQIIEGKAFINGEFQNCCIGITNGKITRIKKILTGNNLVKFRKKIILPAGIDIHVHFRDPGLTKKEDFSTGSLSAAFGGISCIFDMPNTVPYTDNIKNLEEKIKLAKNKSYLDFGIFVNINNKNLNEISSFEKRCSGFKIFMSETSNFSESKKLDLITIFKNISSSKKPLLIHAEDQRCLEINNTPTDNLIDYNNSRPFKCEIKAINNVFKAAENLNLKIHICHLSSLNNLNILKNKKENITFGVTPNHLFFNIENDIDKNSYIKVNPPIRNKSDNISLFNGINNGLIDIFESDHAPHNIWEKNAEFNNTPAGIPGVETMFPLLLYLVKKDKLSFNKLINMISEKPAEIMNIPKGKLEPGRDADFIVLDFKKIDVIKSENLHYKCEWTPYENYKAILPDQVFLRGEKIIDNQNILIKKGYGEFVGD